jgi:hypothetical protein
MTVAVTLVRLKKITNVNTIRKAKQSIEIFKLEIEVVAGIPKISTCNLFLLKRKILSILLSLRFVLLLI